MFLQVDINHGLCILLIQLMIGHEVTSYCLNVPEYQIVYMCKHDVARNSTLYLDTEDMGESKSCTCTLVRRPSDGGISIKSVENSTGFFNLTFGQYYLAKLSSSSTVRIGAHINITMAQYGNQTSVKQCIRIVWSDEVQQAGDIEVTCFPTNSNAATTPSLSSTSSGKPFHTTTNVSTETSSQTEQPTLVANDQTTAAGYSTTEPPEQNGKTSVGPQDANPETIFTNLFLYIGIGGGVVFLFITTITLVVFFCRRRKGTTKSTRKETDDDYDMTINPAYISAEDVDDIRTQNINSSSSSVLHDELGYAGIDKPNQATKYLRINNSDIDYDHINTTDEPLNIHQKANVYNKLRNKTNSSEEAESSGRGQDVGGTNTEEYIYSQVKKH